MPLALTRLRSRSIEPYVLPIIAEETEPNIRLCCWNINGLAVGDKVDKVRELINKLKIDITILPKSKVGLASPSQKQLEADNCTVLVKPRDSTANIHYGGLALIAKKWITLNQFSIEEPSDSEHKINCDSEGNLLAEHLAVEVVNSINSFNLLALYRQPI